MEAQRYVNRRTHTDGKMTSRRTLDGAETHTDTNKYADARTHTHTHTEAQAARTQKKRRSSS